jgi:hypothetical protein
MSSMLARCRKSNSSENKWGKVTVWAKETSGRDWHGKGKYSAN